MRSVLGPTAYTIAASMFDPINTQKFFTSTPDSQGFNDPGQFVELGLVNQIRPRVKAWREASWLGATGITRRLLEHWHDPNQHEGMRFFFWQMEAIETLIWLTEAPAAEKQGI